jgi:hypothetical protein
MAAQHADAEAGVRAALGPHSRGRHDAGGRRPIDPRTTVSEFVEDHALKTGRR